MTTDIHTAVIHNAVVGTAVVAAGGPAGAGPEWLNAKGITALLLLVAGLVGAIIGIAMLGKSNKKKVPEQAEHGLNAFIAFVVIAASLTGVLYSVAAGGLSTFFSGGGR
jgi:zinc transporter ZupT